MLTIDIGQNHSASIFLKFSSITADFNISSALGERYRTSGPLVLITITIFAQRRLEYYFFFLFVLHLRRFPNIFHRNRISYKTIR